MSHERAAPKTRAAGPRRLALACRVLGLLLPATRAVAQPAAPATPIEVRVRSAPSRAPSASSRLGAEEARRSAGTQGDAIKAIASLPGVARAGAGDGEVVLWGSAPSESRFYVDGVPIPLLYHGSGIRSVLPSAFLSTLDLVPGAYGAAYGRGLGGLVSLTTRRLGGDTPALRADVDLLDASIIVRAPWGRDAGVTAAGRFGYADRVVDRLTDRDVGSLLSVPRYQDWQLKLSEPVSERSRVEALYLGSRDRLVRRVPSSDPARRSSEANRSQFQRLGLRYIDEAAGRTEVTAFVGEEAFRRSARTGTSGWGLEQERVLYGLRAAQRVALGEHAATELGLDALGAVSDIERRGTLALPAREGDPFVFGQEPPTDLAHDRYRVHVLDVAPYVEADIALGPLRLSPALRLGLGLFETDTREPRLARIPTVGDSRLTLLAEPRIAVVWSLDERASVFVRSGLYHQQPEPEDASAVFGNPDLAPARAFHVSLGENVRLARSLTLEVVAYYKRLWRLAVGNRDDTPSVAEALLARGTGVAFGAQLLLRQRFEAGFSGWLSATIARSERDAPGEPARLFDHDQPLVAAAALVRRLGPWSLSARVRYASGSPRTPIVGATNNLSRANYEPIFGRVNSTRLPAFFQADLRVDRRWALGEAGALEVYVDWLNVTARRNAEEVVYAADYRSRAYMTGLPPLVVLGVGIER